MYAYTIAYEYCLHIRAHVAFSNKDRQRQPNIRTERLAQMQKNTERQTEEWKQTTTRSRGRECHHEQFMHMHEEDDIARSAAAADCISFR